LLQSPYSFVRSGIIALIISLVKHFVNLGACQFSGDLSPGVNFRRFTAGPGPDLVQLRQRGLVQLDNQGAQAAGQLLQRARRIRSREQATR